jgi:hypothetical protein
MALVPAGRTAASNCRLAHHTLAFTVTRASKGFMLDAIGLALRSKLTVSVSWNGGPGPVPRTGFMALDGRLPLRHGWNAPRVLKPNVWRKHLRT